MKGIVKKIVSILLLFVIAGLVYACIKSIMEPINFNKQKASRETVGIQRMKDVRTLQEAFKSVSGHFTASADSLVDFYKNGIYRSWIPEITINAKSMQTAPNSPHMWPLDVPWSAI